MRIRCLTFILLAGLSANSVAQDFLDEVESWQCPKVNSDRYFPTKEKWFDISGKSDIEIESFVKNKTSQIVNADYDNRLVNFKKSGELETKLRTLKVKIENDWQHDLDYLSNQWRTSVVAFESAKREVEQVELYNSQIRKHKEIIERLHEQKVTLKDLFNEKIMSLGKKVFVASSVIVAKELNRASQKDIETVLNQRASEMVVEHFSDRKFEVFNTTAENIIKSSKIRVNTSGRYMLATQFPMPIQITEATGQTRQHALATVTYYPFEMGKSSTSNSNLFSFKLALNKSALSFKSKFWAYKDSHDAIEDYFKHSIDAAERRKVLGWIKYELNNIERDNEEVEQTLHLYHTSLRQNLNEIDKKIRALTNRVSAYKSQKIGLRANASKEEDHMDQVKRCYDDYLRDKAIVTFRKGYIIGESSLEGSFRDSAKNALSRNEVLQGSYSNTILVSNNQVATDMETKTITWNAKKDKLKIVYLTKEKAGLLTQYSALIAIKHKLNNAGLTNKPVPELEEEPLFLDDDDDPDNWQ